MMQDISTPESMPTAENIRKNLTDITDSQLDRFVTQFRLLREVEQYFKDNDEDSSFYKKKLESAQKALDYKQPYRIAVIGGTGAGKSTLINAMLGRDLVPAKHTGKPATGTILEIFLDLVDGGEEKATVTYQKGEDIQKLLKKFLDYYRIDGNSLSKSIDEKLKSELVNIKPGREIIKDTDEDTRFTDARKTIVDIIEQYLNNGGDSLGTDTFSINNPSEKEKLDLLIVDDDSSSKVKSSTRRSSFIKSVTYHIQPPQATDSVPTLLLPSNVCLVDLPGTDGTSLHETLIRKGIQQASAMVFVFNPLRFEKGTEKALISNMGKSIGFLNNVKLAERIFFVLTKKDTTTEQERLDIPRKMHNFIETAIPGYTNQFPNRSGGESYFFISAYPALQAIKTIQGKGKFEDLEKYNTALMTLGLESDADPSKVLKASQFPIFIENLTSFVREKRIEGQLREAESSLRSIVESLDTRYENEKYESSHKMESGEFLTKERKKLEKEVVYEFRLKQMQLRDERLSQLKERTKDICDSIDKTLKAEMPKIWECSEHEDRDPTSLDFDNKNLYKQILGSIQWLLWEQLTKHGRSLANYLTQLYIDALVSDELAKKIADRSYSKVDAAELQLKIEEWVDANMRRIMADTGGRIAITEITDPDKIFINPNIREEDNQFLQCLNNITSPRQFIGEDSFDEFISLVHEHYEPIVSDYSTKALLNVYRYEMIRTEKFLLKYIKDVFDQINPSEINESILTSESESENGKMHRKLKAIDRLKTLLNSKRSTVV